MHNSLRLLVGEYMQAANDNFSSEYEFILAKAKEIVLKKNIYGNLPVRISGSDISFHYPKERVIILEIPYLQTLIEASRKRAVAQNAIAFMRRIA